jgi:hypothetical protein
MMGLEPVYNLDEDTRIVYIISVGKPFGGKVAWKTEEETNVNIRLNLAEI